MSVYLYEEALTDKLKQITGDSRIHIVPPEMAITYLAQFDKDKVEFPAIVLSRNSVSLLDYKNQVTALYGQPARMDEEGIITNAQLLPMKITWSVDVFAVDRFTCDEIIRELVFFFTTHPRFEVKVPYNLDITQNFDLFVSTEIADNSDLISFPNKGDYFRETITIYTENAHMFSSNRIYPTYIKPYVEMENNTKGDE